MHSKIARERNGFLHKLSNQIASSNSAKIILTAGHAVLAGVDIYPISAKQTGGKGAASRLNKRKPTKYLQDVL